MTYEQYNANREHNTETLIARASLTDKMLEKLEEFITEYCENKSLKPSTKASYVRPLVRWGEWLVKEGFTDYSMHGISNNEIEKAKKCKDKKKLEEEISKAKKKKILAYFKEKNGIGSSIFEWTKLAVKVYYRWADGMGIDKGDPYPEYVAWIRLKRNEKKILAADLITPEQFKRMLALTKHPRDRT
ncbi:hypothetical protein DRN67_04270, partial [Candidatus Micrarchaeota archaeon]